MDKNERERIKKVNEENDILFKNWCTQWDDLHDEILDIINPLKKSFLFSLDLISVEIFKKDHDSRLSQWKEAKYIARDIEFADRLLIKLDPDVRRNALAALNGYQSAQQLAEQLEIQTSTLSTILNFSKPSTPNDNNLLRLSLYLDAPDHTLKFKLKTSTIISSFIEYDQHSKSINLKDLKSNIELQQKKYEFYNTRILGKYYLTNKTIYIRVQKEATLTLIETYLINENEIYVFKFYLPNNIKFIIITPAFLRGIKKIIYVMQNNSDDEHLNLYISEVKKRRFTRVMSIT